MLTAQWLQVARSSTIGEVVIHAAVAFALLVVVMVWQGWRGLRRVHGRPEPVSPGHGVDRGPA